MKFPDEKFILICTCDIDKGGCGSGVKKVYNKFDTAGKEDITWKLYDNDRHEILNETDRDVVYHDILAWMNVHLA